MPDAFGDDWCYLLTAQCPSTSWCRCELPDPLFLSAHVVAAPGAACPCTDLVSKVMSAGSSPGVRHWTMGWDYLGTAGSCVSLAVRIFCFEDDPDNVYVSATIDTDPIFGCKYQGNTFGSLVDPKSAGPVGVTASCDPFAWSGSVVLTPSSVDTGGATLCCVGVTLELVVTG